jgi:uncharacterized protein (TIGR00255 family)
MALQSMTGFGRSELLWDRFHFIFELKSVNNRYREFRFKMPGQCSQYELDLRKKIESHFVRGTFDISLMVKRTSSVSDGFNIDAQKVVQFLNTCEEITSPFKEKYQMQFSLSDLLKQDFAKNEDEEDEKKFAAAVFETFEQAMVKLKKSRLDEGAELKGKLLGHLQSYEKSLGEIKKLKGTFQSKIKERLEAKLGEIQLNVIDPQRLAQEIIFYLEKADVDEELNRASIHCQKLMEILKGSEIGRKLEFTLQELNRETNTIGSKAIFPEISDFVVGMKIELEKMREQSLNIE